MSAFFEEFITTPDDGMTPKCIGVRVVDTNESNRPLGAAGRRDFVLTEPIELQRCFKTVVVKASKKKPVKVFTMLQKLGK